MTGGSAESTGVETAEGGVEVLLVGADADLRDALAERLTTRRNAVVRATGDRTSALEVVSDVDCVVSTAVVDEPDSGAFLEAVRARDESLPLIAYVAVDETSTLLDGLATGYTDVVPRNDEGAVDVLASRVLVAVDAARAQDLAREQATALRAERDRFAALFENIPEPTVFYEMDGDDPVAIDVNQAFESVFGYDAETVRGDLVDEYIVPEEKAAEAAALNDRIAGGEHLDTEVRRSTADGERDFLLRDVPLPEADGMRGYAIYTDITPQRKREERLRETTSRLESQNERLESFTGVVSHDLRHPLSVAMTYTGLLQERYDDEDLDAIDTALERMDDLIQDLLTLARQGTQSADRTLLSFGDAVADAWSAVDTAGATLETDLGNAAVRADESRLRQLLENLFANSVEHGSTSSRPQSDDSVERGVDANDDASDLTVTVGLVDDEDGRGFYVADDGVGIPVDERERVFDQGYSGDGGTGFGLAIVDAVADANDWTVEIEDSEQGGVRFEFRGVDVVT